MPGQIPYARSPYKTPAVDDVTFTFTAEAANARTVTIQAKGRGGNIAFPAVLDVFLSDVATGFGLAAVAPTGGVAIGASGAILNAKVAGKWLECQTTVAGLLALAVTEAGVKTFYVCVLLPDGSVKVSGALAFV